MRRHAYPTQSGIAEIIRWANDGWSPDPRRGETSRILRLMIERLALPEPMEELRTKALYGRTNGRRNDRSPGEPSRQLLEVLVGNLQLNGYIHRDRNQRWNPTPLTARQLHIVRLVAGGATYPVVATELGSSPNTVSEVVSRAMGDVGASNVTHLVAMAYQWGWLPTRQGSMNLASNLGANVSPGYQILDTETT